MIGPLRQSHATSRPDTPSARLMGELVRSEARWSVYLESRSDGNTVVGRIHFYDGVRRRTSAWIFREWSEPEVIERFNTFSPVQLWDLLESLA